MKKTIMALAIILAATTVTFAQMKMDTAQKQMKMKQGAKKYTCTMHPEVVKTKPGKCTKCGMDLVPMKTKMKGKKMEKPMGEMKM